MYAGGYDSADDCTKLTKNCQKLSILENNQHFDFHWSEHRNDITLLKLSETLPSTNNFKKIDIVPREKNIKGILILVITSLISSIEQIGKTIFYKFFVLLKIVVGEPLHITGFGKTAQTIFNRNTKLNYGTVYLWDVDECKEALTLFDDRPILETNYCAGQKRANGGWTGSCTSKVFNYIYMYQK